jgi:hypothetical protein
MRCLTIHAIARNQIEMTCEKKVGFLYGFIKVYFYNYEDDLVLMTVIDSRIEALDQCIASEIIDDVEFAGTIEEYSKKYEYWNFGHASEKDIAAQKGQPEYQIIEFESRLVPGK